MTTDWLQHCEATDALRAACADGRHRGPLRLLEVDLYHARATAWVELESPDPAAERLDGPPPRVVEHRTFVLKAHGLREVAYETTPWLPMVSAHVEPLPGPGGGTRLRLSPSEGGLEITADRIELVWSGVVRIANVQAYMRPEPPG